jgi:DNA modification methylase
MMINVTSLTHHPLNKNIYQLSTIGDLMDSIKTVGLLQPLTIDQHFQVISGNRRFEAIKRLGWEEVEVLQVEIEDEHAPVYLIHFNKQRVKTSQEFINEYDTLYQYYGLGQGRRTDLETSVQLDKGSAREKIRGEIGISSGHLARLLYIRNNNSEFIELIDKGIMTANQAYLQVQRDTKVKRFLQQESKSEPPKDTNWEFYQKSSHHMIELEDESIQTIFTSPPYWNKRRYTEEGGLGNEEKSDEFVLNLSEHLRDCWRVLHPKGSFFLNLGDTFYNGNLQNIPHKVVIKLQDNGWILRNTIIWSKTNPKPSSSKSNLTPSYEFIFHLVKGTDYDYNPTLTPLKDSTKPSHPPRHRNMNGISTSVSPYIPNVGGKNMGDYWDEDIVRTAVSNQPKKEGIEHPAPFPYQIVTIPLLQTSKEGDKVLDPFCGSGTVGRVCDSLNRKFIGYDLVKMF